MFTIVMEPIHSLAQVKLTTSTCPKPKGGGGVHVTWPVAPVNATGLLSSPTIWMANGVPLIFTAEAASVNFVKQTVNNTSLGFKLTAVVFCHWNVTTPGVDVLKDAGTSPGRFSFKLVICAKLMLVLL